MLGCVKDANATTAMTNMVWGMNQPESMENWPKIKAPMTDKEVPKDSGVLREASFSRQWQIPAE